MAGWDIESVLASPKGRNRASGLNSFAAASSSSRSPLFVQANTRPLPPITFEWSKNMSSSATQIVFNPFFKSRQYISP